MLSVTLVKQVPAAYKVRKKVAYEKHRVFVIGVHTY